MGNDRYKTEAALENSRRRSHEAKRRRKGKCVECGGPTSYAGHAGRALPDRCAPCNGRFIAGRRRDTGALQAEILEILANGPATIADLVSAVGKSYNHVHVELYRMVSRGHAVRVRRGVYDLPERS